MNWKYDNDHLTKIQKNISSKNEILCNLFVDTHTSQNTNKRGNDIQIVSQ